MTGARRGWPSARRGPGAAVEVVPPSAVIALSGDWTALRGVSPAACRSLSEASRPLGLAQGPAARPCGSFFIVGTYCWSVVTGQVQVSRIDGHLPSMSLPAVGVGTGQYQ